MSEYGYRAGEAGDKTYKVAEQLRFWMRLTGYYNLVVGALMCLTICYMFPGMIMCLLGYLSLQAGDHVVAYVDSKDPAALEALVDTLRTKYLIHGLQAILAVGVVVLNLVILFVYVGFFVVVLGVGGLAAMM
jgi:hypothetical protein